MVQSRGTGRGRNYALAYDERAHKLFAATDNANDGEALNALRALHAALKKEKIHPSDVRMSDKQSEMSAHDMAREDRTLRRQAEARIQVLEDILNIQGMYERWRFMRDDKPNLAAMRKLDISWMVKLDDETSKVIKSVEKMLHELETMHHAIAQVRSEMSPDKGDY